MFQKFRRVVPTGLLALLLSVSIGWSSAALSGGVEGNGSNRSAVPLGNKVLKLSFGTSYAWGSYLNTRRLVLDEGDSTGLWIRDNGFARHDYNFALAFGLTRFLDASLYVPYYSDSDERGNSYSGVGDLKLSIKVNYPPYRHNPIFELSYLLAFDFPTANDQRDGGFARDPYVLPLHKEIYPGVYTQGNDWKPYGSNSTVTTMMLLLTLNMKAVQNRVPLLLHGNFGLSLADTRQENIFHLGAGAEFWFGQYVALSWAAKGEMDVSHATKHIRLAAYPMSHRVGLIVAVPEAGISLEGGAQLVTNLKSGRDAEWGECNISDDPRCGETKGDVQDRGDTDYIHNQYPKKPETFVKYSRVPGLAIYGGLSIAIKMSDDSGYDFADAN